MSPVCPICNAPQPRPGQKFCARCGGALPAVAAAPSLTPASLPNAPGPTVRVGAGGAKLCVEDSGQSTEVALGAAPLTLGRAQQNQVVLVSRFVSANHARIEPEGAGHRIVDIGSTNGLLYQGQRLPAHAPLSLADGDIIRIGDPIGGSFVTLSYINPAAARAPQVARIDLPAPGASLVIGR